MNNVLKAFLSIILFLIPAILASSLLGYPASLVPFFLGVLWTILVIGRLVNTNRM